MSGTYRQCQRCRDIEVAFGRLIEERDRLRETVTRLNRRCQRLEAGMAARLEDMRRRDHRAIYAAHWEISDGIASERDRLKLVELPAALAERDRYRRTLQGLASRGCFMPGDGLCRDHGPLQPLCASCTAALALAPEAD